MREFTIGGARYRTSKQNAFEQWALYQAFRPTLPALGGLDRGMHGRLRSEAEDITAALAPLLRAKDEDLKGVFRCCVAACRIFDGSDWIPIAQMPSLPTLMIITNIVYTENLAAFFSLTRNAFQASQNQVNYQPVFMPNNEDWLFRPVLRGMCKAESLYDGTLSIEHLAKLNDALDVESENQERMRAALQRT